MLCARDHMASGTLSISAPTCAGGVQTHPQSLGEENLAAFSDDVPFAGR